MSDETKTDTPDGQAKPESPLNITQSQLDALIEARLTRERKKYEDYEAVKSKAETLEAEIKKREEAELSEIQKHQKRIAEQESIIAEYKKDREWRQDWEMREEERINTEAENLSDAQKAIISSLPLDRRMSAINEFKAVTSNPANVNTSKGAKIEKDVPTREEVTALRVKFGAEDPTYREAYRKYAKARGII